MMKHDRSRRRDVRRKADPSVICLPGPSLPYTPPRKAPPPTNQDAAPPADEADALARKNIYEVQPRMSRQARRKAARAEKKAARRGAAERFVAGAPSLAQAAQQFAILPAGQDMTAQLAMAGPASTIPERTVPEPTEDAPAAHEAEPCHCLADEAGMVLPEAIEECEPLSVEEVAEIISATGPLVMTEATEPEDPEIEVSAAVGAEIESVAPKADAEVPEPVLTAAETEALSHAQAEDWTEAPQEAAPAAADLTEDDGSAAPLPRNRALVPARRSWLMRLVPWLRPRRPAPAPEPALAQLQELRFELATALRRLDQLIDSAA